MLGAILLSQNFATIHTCAVRRLNNACDILTCTMRIISRPCCLQRSCPEGCPLDVMASNMKANETAASRCFVIQHQSTHHLPFVRIDRVATLARERRQEVQEEVQEQEQLVANDGAMADVANNQAHLFHRSSS